jgi:hypothetical protein
LHAKHFNETENRENLHIHAQTIGKWKSRGNTFPLFPFYVVFACCSNFNAYGSYFCISIGFVRPFCLASQSKENVLKRKIAKIPKVQISLVLSDLLAISRFVSLGKSHLSVIDRKASDFKWFCVIAALDVASIDQISSVKAHRVAIGKLPNKKVFSNSMNFYCWLTSSMWSLMQIERKTVDS